MEKEILLTVGFNSQFCGGGIEKRTYLTKKEFEAHDMKYWFKELLDCDSYDENNPDFYHSIKTLNTCLID